MSDFLYDGPDGFILSEAAIYAFRCQDVFPDIVSFAAAIPDHLKQLFLIPVKLEPVTMASEVAAEIAGLRTADGAVPTGDTDEAELFGTKTFVYDDNEPTVPSSEPGSIFEQDCADELTHHQEYNFDWNDQAPTDTTFMEDVDMTQYWDYPYRTKESPVRHSSLAAPWTVVVRLALKPEQVMPHTPDKIRENARACTVSLTSYDKKSRVFTFAVDAGNGPRTVRAALSAVDQVALSCDCPFWRYNGPEFNAKNNSFMFGQPYGTAAPPDVRDPDRQYWLCKHAYAVLRRLDGFVQQVVDENWEMDDQEILEEVDREWDRLEGAVKVPLEDTELDVDVEFEEELAEEEREEPEVPEPSEGPPLDELDELDVPVYVEGPGGEDVPFDYSAVPEPSEGPPLDDDEEPEVTFDYTEPEEGDEELFDYSGEPEDEERPKKKAEEPEEDFDYSEEQEER